MSRDGLSDIVSPFARPCSDLSISHVKGCGETGKIESRTATTFRPKKKGPGVRPGALEAGSWKLISPAGAGLITSIHSPNGCQASRCAGDCR